MLHPIAPEVDINFYGSQAKENVGLDSDIGLLILVDKEKLSYDAEIFVKPSIRRVYFCY